MGIWAVKWTRGTSPDLKIPRYLFGEDIENYLLHFEHIARTWGWPEVEWACHSVPLPTGKVLEAYSAMDEEMANLKVAFLTKFDISPETYHWQFWSRAVPLMENSAETYHCLRGRYRRWICLMQRTKEDIGEQIILEQLLHFFFNDICTSLQIG